MVAALILATAAVASTATAHHVRSVDARIHAFLVQGLEQSPTLRRLVLILDQSDVIVYLDPSIRRPQLGGYLLHQIVAAGGVRYLRVKIVDKGDAARIVSTIAHELQHAIEVAQAPDVRDGESMETLFSRLCDVERRSVGYCYETTAARLVETSVRDEMRAQGRIRRLASAERLTAR